MTTFAFSIQNRVGGRVELCIGKFVRQRKQLGKIKFVHGESFASQQKRCVKIHSSKNLLKFVFPQLFCFGNWRMLLEDSTSERRGRNFADCIFAIPLQEKDSFKEMFLAKEAKVAFPPMPHWLQQQT